MTSAQRPAMPFQVTVQPSGRALQRRARRTDPRRGDPPGHRPALRLQGRRLRLVQVPDARRPRHPRRAPEQGAERRGRGRRLHPHLLRARRRPTSCSKSRRSPAPASSRSARCRARVTSHRASRRPTWRCCRLQLPANDTLRYHAGQYIEFILRDGARRSYSMANAPHTQEPQPGHRTAHPPHARRQVHRPRVRRDEGEGDPARRGPVRQLLPARGLRQADGPAGLGHRLRADQGDHRAHAASRASSAPATLYWGGRRPGRPVPGRLGREAAAPRCRTCATCR